MMAGNKKAATILEAARALVTRSPEVIRPEHRAPLNNLITSAYLTSPELHYLHEKLAEYSGKLAVLGFIYSELTIPRPGPTPGAVQAEIPGCYKVTLLPDLTAGIVDAGKGRRFLSIAWGGENPGTVILRHNTSPDCWVEVDRHFHRKEPEAAVTCLLLSHGDPGTPFDRLKRNMDEMGRRHWGERTRSVKASSRGSQK
jgi:hypothetical protein